MKYLITIFCITIFISCFQPRHANNEFTEVELARSGAGLDNGTAISINSSLQYHYYHSELRLGQKAKSDYFVGKASREFWDTLSIKLNAIHYKTIDSTDNRHIEDEHYYELVVKAKTGKSRIIRMRTINSKDSISKMFEWLNDSHKNVRLEKSTSPFKFETTFQNHPDWKALGVDIGNMKFLPPMKRK